MISGNGGNLVVGTRVDCLFDDDYFRGTVDMLQDGDRFRVCFDDGDVRENVPSTDIALPLATSCRVECMFEDEGDFYEGAIGRDNGDASYRVEFDDGDVVEAAPRQDIRVLFVNTEHTLHDDDGNVKQGEAVESEVWGDQDIQARTEKALGVTQDFAISTPAVDAHREQHYNSNLYRVGEASNDRHRSVDSCGKIDAESGTSGDRRTTTKADNEAAAVEESVEATAGPSGGERASFLQHMAAAGHEQSGRQQNIHNPNDSSSHRCFEENKNLVRNENCPYRASHSTTSSNQEPTSRPHPISSRNRSDVITHGLTSPNERRSQRKLSDNKQTATTNAVIASGGRRWTHHSDHAAGQKVDGRAERKCVWNTGKHVRSFPAVFKPTATNALDRHLNELLRTPGLAADAPPDYRRIATSYRIAELEEHQRVQEARGEAWSGSFGFQHVGAGGGTTFGRSHFSRGEIGGMASTPGIMRGSGDNEGSAIAKISAGIGVCEAGPFSPHLPLRKVVEELFNLRMRQVALVRLCHGDTCSQMAGALCDLAEDYAKAGLWPQVSRHKGERKPCRQKAAPPGPERPC